MKGRERRRRIALLTIITAAIWTLAPMPRAGAQQAASAPAYSEHEVKAAYLFNFASFVEWPAVEPGGAVIDFAVLNAPLLEAALERFARGRTVQGRNVRVRNIRSINELRDDDVLFVGAAENWRLRQLISAVRGPTLVVTDASDGLSAGAMINFQLVDRRVRFEIALPAAQEAGLTLSSRLLAAALRVETSRCRFPCGRLPPPRPLVLTAHAGARMPARAAEVGTGSGPRTGRYL